MAQKDPLVEYRNEGHLMFTELNYAIRAEVISLLFHMPVEVVPADEALPAPGGNGGGPNGNLTYEHSSLAGADAIAAAGAGAGAVGTAVAGDGSGAPVQQTVVKSDHENIGRNDPCWCGSGKKFKRCHGA
jgi:preprotein translocase subunit SecA